MPWKRVSVEMTFLLAVSVLLALISNTLATDRRKLSWVGKYSDAAIIAGEARSAVTPAPRAPSSPDATVDGIAAIAPPKDPALLYLEISGDVAERLYQAGALFIDARRSAAYQSGHIEKALSIPVWEHDADARAAALHERGVKPDQVIVVYCSGQNCADSKLLSEKLAMVGYYNIYVYEGGYPDWEKRGLPVTRGGTP